MAETVAALYAKLGLDLSSLDSDFALADKTMTQAISRLNHESKKIKINTDIDLNGLNGAKLSVAGLEVQERSLTAQLEIQRQKVSLVNAAYLQMVTAKGAESAASAKLETRLLNERKAYASLETQLKSVQKARSQSGTMNKMVNSIINGASAASVIGQGAAGLGALSLLQSPLGKAAGVAVAVGGSMVTMAKSAMTAGNNIYTLARKMQTTNAEAARMNMIFRLAGADANAAVPAIVRLDKAVQNAGDAGNQTTRILAAFGINLKDSAGNLLPVNQQLIALAEGYNNAAAAGLENEYVAQVLGARGAELVPVLQQMTDLQEQAARIPTTGLLNPDEAHQMNLEWNEMKVSIGQLTGSVSAAIMPVVKDFLPDINQGVETLVKAIKDNKSGIEDFIKTIASIGSVAVKACKVAANALDGLGVNAKNARTLLNFGGSLLDDVGNTVTSIKNTLGNTALADAISTGAKWLFEDYIPKDEEESQPSDSENTDSAKSADKNTIDPEKVRDAYRRASDAAKRSGAGGVAGPPDIGDDVYRATHNDLQNQLHDIDLRAEKLRAEGVEENEIVRLTEAQKAKVYRDFNDSTIAQINRAWKSELENRLDDIDREKRAFIQKGVDEVTATRWAEAEKGKARQEAGLQALKQQKQYLEIYRQSMAGPGSMEQRTANARVGILEMMRQQYGLQGEHITPQELMGFTSVFNDAKNNLVPGLEVSGWARELEKNTIPVIRGSNESHEVPGITTNVTINGGVYTNNETITRMTNDVADRINSTLGKVINASNLSYQTG